VAVVARQREAAGRSAGPRVPAFRQNAPA